MVESRAARDNPMVECEERAYRDQVSGRCQRHMCITSSRPLHLGNTLLMAYMYIVECADCSFYVGSSFDVEQRVWQHNNEGGAAYTRRRRPVKLVYFEEYARIDEAYAREKQVQNWGRAKRQALIDGVGMEILPALAKKRFHADTGLDTAVDGLLDQRDSG